MSKRWKSKLVERTKVNLLNKISPNKDGRQRPSRELVAPPGDCALLAPSGDYSQTVLLIKSVHRDVFLSSDTVQGSV